MKNMNDALILMNGDNEVAGFVANVKNVTNAFLLTKETEGLYFWTSECDKDFEILGKTAEEVLSVMHKEWVNEGWSDGPFTDGDAIMKTLQNMNASEEMLDAVDTFLCGALMILNGDF
jgi:hypothetical protein